MYAFSVPVNPMCTVQSVTLPDVSASVRPTVASGVSQPQPALHIFGMALRNNTTATPQVGGSSMAAPAKQGWTGAFEAPAEALRAAGRIGLEQPDDTGGPVTEHRLAGGLAGPHPAVKPGVPLR